jgi:hypothetical protein
MIVQLWLLLWLFGTQTPRPATPPARGAFTEARTSISGVVVRAGTTQPINGAQVQIRQTGATGTTDLTGKFSFDVAPGRYTLTVDREGFVLQEDPKNALTPSGMVLTVIPGQNIENVILPMISAPVISGYTYSPAGEPLAGAAVHAYRRRFTPFGPRLRIVKTALTNDLGEYRLFRLVFGDYLVSASYSRREQRAALGGMRLSANLTDPDDGYSTVFYGGGTIPSQARTIPVAPGIDNENLNIIFSDVPRFKVSGRFVSAGELPSNVKMIFLPEGSDIVLDNSFSMSVGAGGLFEIRGVSPGSYVIRASGSSRSGDQSSDVISVNVPASDVSGLAVPLFPTINAKGRVISDTGRNLQGMKVSFVRRSEEIEQSIDGFTAADGTFTVPQVGPGEYEVYVDRMAAGSYIRSIRLAGRDVLSNGVQPGFDYIDPDMRMEIALSSAAATVTGRVLDRAGEPAAGTQVVLVPEAQLRRRMDRYIVGFTDTAGSFQLAGIPPGRYTAYAFEKIEAGAYYAFAYSPRLGARFADRSVSINVSQVKGTSIELKAIPAAETAGGFQ